MIEAQHALLPSIQPRRGILGFLDKQGWTEYGRKIIRREERIATQIQIRRARGIVAQYVEAAQNDPRIAYSIVTVSNWERRQARRAIQRRAPSISSKAHLFVDNMVRYVANNLQPRKPKSWPLVW